MFEALAKMGRVRAAKFASVLLLLCAAGTAMAVPSFARQTGMTCAACHVGGFGPQLTDFGTQFKIGGYTFSKGADTPIPLAAMAIGSYSRTAKSQDPPPEHAKANNNFELDQASLFYAGRISEHMGIFSQATYDGVAGQLAIDNVDLRFAKYVSIGSHSALAGVSVNNSPGVSDPYNSLPPWGFSFVTSPFAPTPDVGTLLDGALAQRVLGVTAYAQIDGEWYAELGTYSTLSNESQARLGLGRTDDPGPLHGALYARLAAKEIWGNHSLSGGAVLFDTRIQPDRGETARMAFRDVGLDVSYRWSPSPEHLVTVLANVIRESQKRDAQVDAGAATNARGRLVEHSLTAAYYWRNTYGVSLQRFALHGGNDDLLYADGFANGSPNWGATRLQVDWTPRAQRPAGEGFQPQWRLGAQYTAWDKFNGAKTNYDGNGRDASDNNTLYVFAWLAF